MKKILPFLTALLLLFTFTAQAQSNKYVFCEVKPIGNFFKGGCTLRVNYGQIRSIHFPKKAQICDKDGTVLIFNSRIDALNWLSENGWEFCSSTISVSGSGSNGDTSVSSSETWILKYCVEGLTTEQIEEVYNTVNLLEP
ncbi:MAG: hypothetical protein ACI3YY_01785 [Candidatus Cryptobacteroides sp.]